MASDSILLAVDHDDEASPAVRFAVQELRRLLLRLTGRTVSVVDAAIPQPTAIVLAHRPELAVDPLDDAIEIDVEGTAGRIQGSNPRSLVIAAYRYLTELGCRWVRPGPDGEFVPAVELDRTRVMISERASHRHRGVCIEGATSVTNLLDLIDWLPKIGLNSYFVQFEDPHVFLRSWYERHADPAGAPTDYPRTRRTEELHRAVLAELERRDLRYHAVGHGWTAGVIGISADGWNTVADTAFRRDLVAEVDGVRDLWHGVPLNTELCYSRAEARGAMARLIADHAAAHPEIDVLHVWLSDGSANHCECADCARLRPADWYVMVLNELDALLTAAGTPTKIAFLAYHQLLWPPQTERISDPDRFVFMFAPIRRDHRVPLSDAVPAELPDYRGNGTEPPSRGADYLALLRAWRHTFDGSSFDFDYHLMWQHCFDPGQLIIARTLHEDARALAGLGLDGLVSCQSQRVFLPDGFAMTIMARTLWDSATSFSTEQDDYLRATYGPDGQLVRDHLAWLSEAFRSWDLDSRLIRRPTIDRDQLAEAVGRIVAFGSVIDDHRDAGHPIWSASWRALSYHAAICLGLCQVLAGVATGDRTEAFDRWAELKATIWDGQDAHQAVFDASNFCRTIEGYLGRVVPAE